MKKSLIALAVVGAFTSSAFAEGSNVQLYGIIDLGITHFNGLRPTSGGGTVSKTGLDSGGQSSSRIGIKGTEDLGGGLKAFFQAETGFCAGGTNQNTDGKGGNSNGYCSGGGFMQRTAIVGLTSNSFGTVVAGRMNSPLWNAQTVADPFASGLTGDFDNLSNTAYLGLQRLNQTVAYVSPDFMGFTGTAAYSFAPFSATQNLTQGGKTTRAWELNGAYNNGPIFASIDYVEATNLGNPLDYSGPYGSYGAVGYKGLYLNSIANDNAKNWQVTGGYDFGIVKVSALYQRLKVDSLSGNRQAWMVGATVPIGPGAVLASYGQVQDSLGKDTLGINTGDNRARQYAIGYTYALSKRTNLYASYAHITNDSGTNLAVGDSSTSNLGVNGQASNGIAVGLRHKF